MTAYISQIPAVVDRLVSEATGAVDDSIQVLDGPLVGDLRSNILVVGLAQSESASYESTVSRQPGTGRARYTEAFEVRCLLSVSTGDWGGDTMSGLRYRCGDTLNALDARLRDLMAQDPEWDSCALASQTQWVAFQTEDGSIVNVMFTIEGMVLL